MSDDRLTITRQGFIAWLSSQRAGEDLWSSLRSFAEATAIYRERLDPNHDRAAIGAKAMEICEIRGVTPYNLVWHEAAPRQGLEIVFLEDPPESLRTALRLGLFDTELELLFSKWDGQR